MPKLAEGAEKRTKQIKVRFTEEEFKLASHLASKSLAVWLREMALDSTQDFVVSEKKRNITLPKKDPELVRQLAAVGNNLNQIATVVNAQKSTLDTALLMAKLEEIEDQLSKISDS
tara:strand:- start:1403 stop:1750 length:348 start_codon:yes stop_codon:yes gene_type:complete